MHPETALIATIAAGLGLAFVFGFAAVRLRLPPLVGYLVAGIVVGPFTPGYVADTGLAQQLAEVGVILLMFGVGLHFSIRDLMAVRRIALPGALLRIGIVTVGSAAVARAWGWPLGGALVFGLALSVASTVVLLRVLEERGTLSSMDGRIAIGWLIVEDLTMVLALVLLPTLAQLTSGAAPTPAAIAGSLVLTLLKVAAFVALMRYVGARLVPWLLGRVARTGSRELFTLSVLAIALGIAFGASSLFGVSFALGAFFAGVVVSESDLSHQAAAEALPLQDAFAVLFFVSVGMVFDPRVLVERPLAVLATVLIAILGKAVVTFAIVLIFRYPVRTALTVAAGLAQVGEFSFILAGLGMSLGLLSRDGQSLILAGAILSITLNALLFDVVEPLAHWIGRRPRLVSALERPRPEPPAPPSVRPGALHDHAVIVGFGRVGGTIGRALEQTGVPFLAVETDREWVESLRARGLTVLSGDATRPGILEHAQVPRARLLVVATPGAYQTRRIIEHARRLNPGIAIVARTHSEAEQRWLERHGVAMAVMGERELALGMTRYALRALDVVPDEIEGVVQRLRSRAPGLAPIVPPAEEADPAGARG